MRHEVDRSHHGHEEEWQQEVAQAETQDRSRVVEAFELTPVQQPDPAQQQQAADLVGKKDVAEPDVHAMHSTPNSASASIRRRYTAPNGCPLSIARSSIREKPMPNRRANNRSEVP